MAYRVEMHADEARERFHQGGTLLLLDAPPSLIFGLDQTSFVVGEKFQGVKMIPSGPHIITTTVVAHDRPVPTVAQWLFVPAASVYVGRWNEDFGRFEPLQDEDEIYRYQLGVQRFDFDAGLAPYPQHLHQQWRQLTGHITQAALESLNPPSGFIDALAESRHLALIKPKTAAERRLLEQLQEGRSRFEQDASQQDTSASVAYDGIEGRGQYTTIPSTVQPPGASAAQLTSSNMDKSEQLRALFLAAPDERGTGLLAELQFAFVSFLAGKSLEGFLQWKALLGLCLSCDEAATQTHQDLFARLLQVLSAQLEVVTEDSIARPAPGAGPEHDARLADAAGPAFGDTVDDLIHDSFLRRSILDFLEVLLSERDVLQADLWHQSQLVRTVLRDRLGWDVDEADEEGGPVVVDTVEA